MTTAANPSASTPMMMGGSVNAGPCDAHNVDDVGQNNNSARSNNGQGNAEQQQQNLSDVMQQQRQLVDYEEATDVAASSTMELGQQQQQPPTKQQSNMEMEQANQEAADEEGDSSSSSSSSEDDSSSDSDTDDGDDDEEVNGLSDYERLRLRNIKRNKKRLAQLGLLVNGTTAITSFASNDSSTSSGQRQPRKRRQSSAPPIPRRSLPRRRCAKLKRLSLNEDDHEDGDTTTNNNGYESDESSMAPSPVKIQRTLCPQPHQEVLDENHLMQYQRTRRSRRGRPKREEYVYKCDEVCKECGGEWTFDIDDEEVEERTRLLRCKDCKGAFHVGCMLIHGKKENDEDGGDEEKEKGDAEEDGKVKADVDGEEEDGKVVAADSDTLLEPPTRDPKRCHQCELQYKLQQQSSSSSSSNFTSLLEAIIDERTVRVKVTPKPALEATVNGSDITCYVTLGGQSNGGSDHSNDDDDNNGSSPAKRVTWSDPLDGEEQEENDTIPKDATTQQIQKLVSRALSDSDHARLQDYSCEALRKHLTTEESTTKVVQLGGIRMLSNSMQHHPDRPIIQAEAMCTLAEVAWRCPQIGMETIRGGCLELAMVAMERHAVHSKVQQMGCGFFRALSYDAKCCTKLKSKAVSAVVDSIRRNPRKVKVHMEGSMFLQNMMVVSSITTVNSIFRSKRSSDSDLPMLLPTLLTAIQTNLNKIDLVFSVFGLLSNVARNVKGRKILRSLDADTLAMDAIRGHPVSPELHDVAFALLQNVINVRQENNEQQLLDLAKMILESMEMHPEEEMLTNACRLLGVISQSTGTVQDLVRSGSGRQVLTLVSENFPDSCNELVDGLLHD